MSSQKPLFKEQRVKDARDNYIAVVESFSPAMLESHAEYLEEELQLKLRTQRGLFRAKKAEPEDSTLGTQIFHLNEEIGALRTAIEQLTSYASEYVFDKLKSEFKKITDAFADPEHAMETPNGKIKREYIRKLYGNSRQETQERYELLDFWYAVGNEFAIEERDKRDRLSNLLLVPREINHAKWRFMTALTDAAYDINLEDSHPNRVDDNNLEILSRLFTKLALRERGADNPHMDEAYKYRHNPAIHSLHVTGLIDKIFHNVELRIMEKTNGLRDRLIKLWHENRNQIMFTALVHDGGEAKVGELSQGITVAYMDSAEAKAQLEQQRNRQEYMFFVEVVDEMRDYVKHTEGQKITDKPITDEEWQRLRTSYIEAFERAERTETFLGRMHKSMERMDSGYDYWRYRGKNAALPLEEATLKNKMFSMDYAPKYLRGAKWDEPAVANADSLASLIASGRDSDEQLLFKLLTIEVMKEYKHLAIKSFNAYKPESQMTEEGLRAMLDKEIASLQAIPVSALSATAQAAKLHHGGNQAALG